MRCDDVTVHQYVEEQIKTFRTTLAEREDRRAQVRAVCLVCHCVFAHAPCVVCVVSDWCVRVRSCVSCVVVRSVGAVVFRDAIEEGLVPQGRGKDLL